MDSDWDVFRTATNNLDEYIEAVTSYISFFCLQSHRSVDNAVNLASTSSPSTWTPQEPTPGSYNSFIPVMASVAQKTHQPLLLLLQECVGAITPELQPESSIYPIITNKGCLVDNKISHSKFEPRPKSSEILLSLQAFKFALREEVFIHCKPVSWDSIGLDNAHMACHYDKEHGWELLNNSAYSNLCDCCESSCKSRKMRSVASGKHGIVQNTVLGPLTITDLNS
ncbi:zona pellucida sperm-binding protein 3-like [Chaetodon auriga]|uniref:zona pellucida sperm-binding protein 3-like n=1 Tax=Chaetodon auriga TaxID=39042 RepID=UPI004032A22B